MFRSDRILAKIHFGSDDRALYLRLDFAQRRPFTLAIEFHEPAGVTLRSALLSEPGPQTCTLLRDGVASAAAAALGDLLEIELPLAALGLAPGAPIGFQIRVFVDDIERECYPEHCPIQFTLLGAEWALEHWTV